MMSADVVEVLKAPSALITAAPSSAARAEGDARPPTEAPIVSRSVAIVEERNKVLIRIKRKSRICV